MRRRSEIVGNALNFTACWAYTRCPRASTYLRVERIVIVAILLSLATAIPAMAADMPAPGPATLPLRVILTQLTGKPFAAAVQEGA
jgi:hypothetical protein